jgi:hypothetical protein
MKNRFFVLATMAVLLTVASSTFAHHAWGEYDMDHRTTVTGTITEFDWGNPHVWMNFDVKDSQGNVQKWMAGGPSPSRMSHTGWSKYTLKPGDQITAVGNRIKDGSNKMRLEKVILANGTQLVCYGSFNGS